MVQISIYSEMELEDIIYNILESIKQNRSEEVLAEMLQLLTQEILSEFPENYMDYLKECYKKELRRIEKVKYEQHFSQM